MCVNSGADLILIHGWDGAGLSEPHGFCSFVKRMQVILSHSQCKAASADLFLFEI